MVVRLIGGLVVGCFALQSNVDQPTSLSFVQNKFHMNKLETLTQCVDNLPDCVEKVVLLTMVGNLHANVSNEPFMELAISVAKQMLADLQ